MSGAILGAQVVDVVGRDERNTSLVGQSNQVLVDVILLFDAVALEFEPKVFGPKDVAQLAGNLFGLLVFSRQVELVDLSA